MTIQVLVIDDQLHTVLRPLQRMEGFAFQGIDRFAADRTLEVLEQHPEITVMLLDIMGETGARENNAGFLLLEQLQQNDRWKQRQQGESSNCHVQIIFFSQAATDERHYRAADARLLQNVAGFIDKSKVLGNQPEARDILRLAHERAGRYREYPILVDPIRSECELVYSPNSQAMHKVWERILAAGRCMENVLIEGETGTGKELVARAIFQVMKNNQDEIGYLISYNIASAPVEGNMLHTELFGALRGAFTGAADDRIGVFERASKNDAPLFLDEIGDAPMPVQIALLRVAQNREIVPLGAFNEDQSVRKLDYMRLITASHAIREAVRQGKFRADLYYRLKTIRIVIPPLRERKDDIAVLTYLFLNNLNEKYGKNIRIDEKDAPGIFKQLKEYDWPGNVRELEGVIHTSYVLSPGTRFILADAEEWRDKLSTTCASDPEQPCTRPDCPRSPANILSTLKNQPCRLSELGKRYGVPTALAVYRELEKRLGRKPGPQECTDYFDDKAENVRKWVENNDKDRKTRSGASSD